MAIDNLKPTRKLTPAQYDNDFPEYRMVEHNGLTFMVGESHLCNAQDGCHAVISVSETGDGDIETLRDIAHDYVMCLFSGLCNPDGKTKILLEYFDIDTNIEAYRVDRCTITGIEHYVHIETGFVL